MKQYVIKCHVPYVIACAILHPTGGAVSSFTPASLLTREQCVALGTSVMAVIILLVEGLAVSSQNKLHL